MAAFDPIEFYGISPNRDVPLLRETRERSSSSSSTCSSISLEAGPISHDTLLSPHPTQPDPLPTSTPTPITLEPEDMVWNIEKSAYISTVIPTTTGPPPLERFVESHERHEQLALALLSVRRKGSHQRHPSHQYTRPIMTDNISINRYLTDNSDQEHERLAYMLERRPAPQPEHGSTQSTGESPGSSISLREETTSRLEAGSEDDGDDIGRIDEEMVQRVLREIKSIRRGEGRLRVRRAVIARKKSSK
ncbi:hypothetical protein QBC38DRAFT_487447 [Podospora fimiseda]|uniref:Uncharacterized protein n=1 Tax=Podospora fimiseda TaxID=252190 RepID=A0AAN7GSJ6_9PEZI|nr:hypothetical protein QBC38DRAFT_487447 [Podospora fimiseda]